MFLHYTGSRKWTSIPNIRYRWLLQLRENFSLNRPTVSIQSVCSNIWYLYVPSDVVFSVRSPPPQKTFPPKKYWILTYTDIKRSLLPFFTLHYFIRFYCHTTTKKKKKVCYKKMEFFVLVLLSESVERFSVSFIGD